MKENVLWLTRWLGFHVEVLKKHWLSLPQRIMFSIVPLYIFSANVCFQQIFLLLLWHYCDVSRMSVFVETKNL